MKRPWFRRRRKLVGVLDQMRSRRMVDAQLLAVLTLTEQRLDEMEPKVDAFAEALRQYTEHAGDR